ncbi:hypothetical protein RF55_19341 [Lasius niger]|uniref:Uncharacterized protein n=1 Tax=Lasius niger TaxID=67767 RepID=A0A0J7MT63_LASNI|nr:hypothetical protein RF55_19341 [Lasius niger]
MGMPGGGQGVGGFATPAGGMQNGVGRLWPLALQGGQDFMPQKIPRQPRVAIGGIVDGAQTMRLHIGGQFGTGDLKQWPPEHASAQRPALTHPAQALGAGAAQQLQQYGFDLIIAVMGEQQGFARLQ